MGAAGKPVISSGVIAGVVLGGAALSGLGEDTANAEPLTLAIDQFTTTASVEEALVADSDDARVAADRSATNVQRSAKAAKAAAAERAKAAALAKARKEAAERAARAAERKRILANAQEDPKSVAKMLMPDYGFGESQWSCLEQLWIGESDWRWFAENPSSGAYGIPQSLPADKMATVGSDWRTNPTTQIKWGLKYIKSAYGTPCNALSAWEARSPHWY